MRMMMMMMMMMRMKMMSGGNEVIKSAFKCDLLLCVTREVVAVVAVGLFYVFSYYS